MSQNLSRYVKVLSPFACHAISNTCIREANLLNLAIPPTIEIGQIHINFVVIILTPYDLSAMKINLFEH